MLDIGWWELLVVGMVALVVVGPKELPTLLRTIGRYVGMAKRQADEFRSQFDDALRESEFNDLRDEMNELKSDMTSSLDEAQQSINKDLSNENLDDEYDWDKDGPIEPAPEFANDDPTTSFTMPDGEVVTKNSAGEVVTKNSDGEVVKKNSAGEVVKNNNDGEVVEKTTAGEAADKTSDGPADASDHADADHAAAPEASETETAREAVR